MNHSSSPITKTLLLSLVGILAVSLAPLPPESSAWAATAGEIQAGADRSLDRFNNEVQGAEEVLKKAKGVLVFPAVFKAGFIFGGEYGEGALRIGGKTVDHYNIAAASFGFQLGAQKKTVMILFMEDGSLKQFRESSGWKAGVDSSIAVVTLGIGGALDTAQLKKPVLGFIFDQKGLMYNLTLEGAKVTKIKK